MQHDEAGRTTLLDYGAGVIRKTFAYFAWNTASQGGLLQGMQAARLSDSVPLQNLAYTYEKNGNVLSISDSLAGPQAQNFGYDALNRLTSAAASGGTSGLYSETYTYDPASGNLASKGGLTYTYADPAHVHAVTGLSNGNSYAYDPNGDMTQRVTGGQTYNLGYDAENRMVSVSGAVTASFLYDGDGKRVMSTIGASTTYFVGNIYEVANGVVTKYYYAGGQRIALRSAGVVSYLLGDHLGSTSITTDAAGLVSSEQRYTAWGEVRYSSGSAGTKYTYTGQYSDSYINLLWYGSRHYDPALGRFISPDTIVPVATQATQAYDRYGYVNNNPLRYNDPTGHCIFGLDTAVCIVAAVFIIGAVMLAGDTTHSRAGDAENFYDLIGAGLSHDKHANIVGAGLESLQDDPSVQAAQKRIVNRITSNIEYEEQAFSLKVITDPNGFTANGPSGNWKQAAVTLNPAFWMVHTGQISATNIKVSADGTILTTWHIHDAFDFIPGPDHTEEYNKLASIIHPIYNGFFHAEETYPTDAYWKQTILPANSCGRCR